MKTTTSSKTYLKHSPNLVNLGLTKQQVTVYLTLLHSGPSTIKTIATQINSSPQNIYRTANHLKTKKLIGILTASPFTLQALPPQLALTMLAKEKTLHFQTTAKQIAKTLSQKPTNLNSININLILGQDKIFQLGAKMAAKAKKELLIVSIGESIPPDLLLANKKAYKRGVIVRMIAHKFDNENKNILESFKKNGYQIRHYPDWGFHLAIIDSQESLLIINNPKNTKERSAVQIPNPNLSKALTNYFYTIWKKAIPV